MWVSPLILGAQLQQELRSFFKATSKAFFFIFHLCSMLDIYSHKCLLLPRSSLGLSEETVIFIVVFVTIVTDCCTTLSPNTLPSMYMLSQAPPVIISVIMVSLCGRAYKCAIICQIGSYWRAFQSQLSESPSERLSWSHSCSPTLHQSGPRQRSCTLMQYS